MKRDIDLVRKILVELEKLPLSDGGHDIQIEGYDSNEVNYHTMLMQEGRLITARVISATEPFQTGIRTFTKYLPMAITWDGHDFLEAARHDQRWEEVKKQIKEKATSAPFDVIKSLLIKLASSQLGAEV